MLSRPILQHPVSLFGIKVLLGVCLVLGLGGFSQTATAQTIMWVNHLDLLPGDSSVTATTYTSTFDFGLVIKSSTTGSIDSHGGIKVVSKGLQIPPGFLLTGVRVCYQLSNPGSFINQIRLSQVQDPPGTAVVMLDDGTSLTDPGPVCVDSASTTVDPSQGAVILDLRVNFGNTSDQITIKSLGVYVM